MDPEYLTVTQARRKLMDDHGIVKSREMIQKLCRQGRIAVIKPGMQYLIPPDGYAQLVAHFLRNDLDTR